MKAADVKVGEEYGAVRSSARYDVAHRVKVIGFEKVVTKARHSWQSDETKNLIRVENIDTVGINLNARYNNVTEVGETTLVTGKNIVGPWADIVASRAASKALNAQREAERDRLVGRVNGKHGLALAVAKYGYPRIEVPVADAERICELLLHN